MSKYLSVVMPASLLLLLIAALPITQTSANCPPAVITAQELQIVDADGTPRIRLFVDSDGSAVAELSSPDHRGTITLEVTESGENTIELDGDENEFWMWNDTGGNQYVVSVDEDSGVSMMLDHNYGENTIYTYANRSSCTMLMEEDYLDKITLSAADSSTGVTISDNPLAENGILLFSDSLSTSITVYNDLGIPTRIEGGSQQPMLEP